MLLAPKPFEMMKSGQKTIELRRYDEKRKHIHIGDRIRFSCTENQTHTSEVQVLELHIFDNFA
ncbi:RNA-binding protein, partial [Streptococcus suis]